tara:strand:+ start:93 stop:875 length:783 start_codon:yes stop_codon:yes gene_type:complete
MGWFGSNKNEEGANTSVSFEDGYTYYLGDGGKFVCRTLTSGISDASPFFSGPIEMVAQADVVPVKGFHYYVDRNGNVTRLAAPTDKNDFEKAYGNLSKAEKLSMAVGVTGVQDSEQEGTNYNGKELFHFLVVVHDQNMLNRERELKEYDRQMKLDEAQDKEKHLDYNRAIEIYDEINMSEEAARIRRLKADLSAPKTVVHGDYVDDRDTIVKDSVINRSSIGASGKSKGEEIKEIKELLDSGAIDEDEFKQMKKEILGNE